MTDGGWRDSFFRKEFLRCTLFYISLGTVEKQGGMTMAEIGGYDASLRSELCAYYEWGLSVLVDEKAYGTEDMNEICRVLEENNYMRDYEEGSRGTVASVHFTKIKT